MWTVMREQEWLPELRTEMAHLGLLQRRGRPSVAVLTQTLMQPP